MTSIALPLEWNHDSFVSGFYTNNFEIMLLKDDNDYIRRQKSYLRTFEKQRSYLGSLILEIQEIYGRKKEISVLYLP